MRVLVYALIAILRGILARYMLGALHFRPGFLACVVQRDTSEDLPMCDRFRHVEIKLRVARGDTEARAVGFAYVNSLGMKCEASFDLFIIREAWDRGASFEDLADGFGPGQGTQGDWSAIRDSSAPALETMLARALNFCFPARKRG